MDYATEALEGSGQEKRAMKITNPEKSLIRPPAAAVAAAGLLAATLSAQAPDGALDPTFGAGGKLMIDFNHSTDIANAVAIAPDGKIVVVGTSYTDNDYSDEDFALSRHNPDGTLDASFGAGGRVTTDFPGLAAVAAAVVVQSDGKIVVAGGAFPLFTFLGDIKIVRYNVDGSLDASFGADGVVTPSFPNQGSYAFALALQPDGRIVAAGTHFVDFSSSSSSNTDFALVRYNSDGTPDASFGVGGQVTTDFDGFNDDAFAILVQPDGKLVAVGSALSQAEFYDFAASRYLENGDLDPSFGAGGKVRTDFGAHDFDRARTAVLQPDGKIVAAGFTIFNLGGTQPFALTRYEADGGLDPTFGGGDGTVLINFGSFGQTAYKALLQADGKIITVGYPNSEGSDSDFLLARCNPNGTLDSTFGIGGKVRTSFGDLNGGANGAALQADGNIVAAGFQATFSEVSAEFALARYLGNSDVVALPGCAGNPAALASASSAAVIGGTLDVSLFASGLTSGLGTLFFGAHGTAGGCGVVAPGLGELLLAPAPAPKQLAQGTISLGTAAFALPVPSDPAIVGVEVALQGAAIGVFDPGVPIELSTGLLVTITQ